MNNSIFLFTPSVAQTSKLTLKYLSHSKPYFKIIVTIVYFVIVSTIYAQPAIQWQKTYGGSSSEEVYAIQQTTDGGYITVGVTTSNNGDVSGNHGGFEFWVLKLTENGSIDWKRAYGGSNNDWPYSIQQTADGGYIMAGLTMSNNGDVTWNHGDRDYWVVKLNPSGSIQWQKTLGGTGADVAFSVRQTDDGGYIVVGDSGSNDGNVSGNHGFRDMWVVKLNVNGGIQWQRSLGGSSTDSGRCVIQTEDGGYMVVGESMSNDGDVSVNHGNSDFWVVKLDEDGVIAWEKSLGGPAADIASAVCQLSDGSYVVAGYVGSGVPGHHGSFDYWVIKLSEYGEIIWDRVFGGSSIDKAFDLKATSDGGLIVVGDTQSVNGDVIGNDGGLDIWAIKLNGDGEIVWQKTIGGSMGEGCYSVDQTSDGGYILGGFTWSIDGDVSGSINRGDSDFWVVKLAPESVGTEEARSHSVDLYPNPAQEAISVHVHGQPEGAPLHISVSDPLGRSLIRQNLPNGQRLDIAALPPGLYILSAVTASGTRYSGKITKTE